MRDIPQVVAQLRHAYMHLAAGAVKDQKRFADGLIAPQIRTLEKFIGNIPDVGYLGWDTQTK